MLTFWLTILSTVLALSFFLAKRSLKNSSPKLKVADIPQSLFLIRNHQSINPQLLEKLHQSQITISFERLFKGQEHALVLFGPTNLVTDFPELNLLELEDYLIPKEETFNNTGQTKINADQSFGTQIPISPEMSGENIFDHLDLAENEQLVCQIIVMPIEDKKELINQFKLTFRAMVATPKKDDKIRLAKRVLMEINAKLGQGNLQAVPNIFDKYRLRVPEGEKIFTIDQVLRILLV